MVYPDVGEDMVMGIGTPLKAQFGICDAEGKLILRRELAIFDPLSSRLFTNNITRGMRSLEQCKYYERGSLYPGRIFFGYED